MRKGLLAGQPHEERQLAAGDKHLTTREAAALLRVGVSSFWRLRAKNAERFPRAFYLTARPTWSRAELLEFARGLREKTEVVS